MDKQLFAEYAKNPTIEKRNEIVEEHLYLVDILIRKYIGKGVEYDDLYQVGALALVNAVERFDPSKGYEFSSFATPTILGEIKKYFRDKQWSLKVPRRMKEIAAIVQRSIESFQHDNQRQPTIDEIALDTGFSEEDIIESMESAKAYAAYSLDKTFDEMGEEGDGLSLEKYIGFEDSGFNAIEFYDLVDDVLDQLSDTYRLIFRERFVNGKTQSEIAESLGVSQMTVSRAEKSIRQAFVNELQK
ncbi:MAG: sigma-70 family RNA polymerase sigma factor [Clostridia bacterium]|nr:sigma-70 family RNA polymerase sigma factor [Clostridia bacterium]